MSEWPAYASAATCQCAVRFHQLVCVPSPHCATPILRDTGRGTAGTVSIMPIGGLRRVQFLSRPHQLLDCAALPPLPPHNRDPPRGVLEDVACPQSAVRAAVVIRFDAGGTDARALHRPGVTPCADRPRRL